MCMCRYLPKRLELLLSIVLALPKLSNMGKISIGYESKNYFIRHVLVTAKHTVIQNTVEVFIGRST